MATSAKTLSAASARLQHWPKSAYASTRVAAVYGWRVQLRCEECTRLSDEQAFGWLAMLADDPDEDEFASVVVYCPGCAAREFEITPTRRSGEGS
jgi:hypothetical protein